MGTSQVFSAHEHSYAYVHGHVGLQKHVRAFQIPQ